jgi:suppressor of ftsI
MDRRRFIVTGISTAAIASVLATDACTRSGQGGSSLLPSGGDLRSLGSKVYTLNVQYATTTIGGKRLRGRTYNGKTVGPMFVIRPGDTFSMKLVNKLPPNPVSSPQLKGPVLIPAPHDSMEAMDPTPHGPFKPTDSIDPMNNPHNFNTTNMHVHGIQTIPHLFQPLGTSDPAAEMIQVQPGQTYRYDFPIPLDHPSGLHWYHPHNHGSTDVQVSNGMAGLIVVRGPIDEVPEIKAAREIFMVLQTLDVNPNKKNPNLYEREYISFRSPQNGGYTFSTQFTMITLNGQGINWVNNKGGKDNSTKIYSGLPLPQFNVKPGEVVRIRLLNGTNYLPLFLAIPGFAAWQIGFDGVNTLTPIPIDMSGKGISKVTPENLFTSKNRLAMPANRIELLLQAPMTPGTYTMKSLKSDRIFFGLPELPIADFVVGGSPVTMGIPKTLPVPTREYPVIESKDIVNKRTFRFDQGARTDLLMGFGFTVNGVLYQMDSVPTAVKVGTCEEWRFENTTEDAHPIHLHENSFQLIAINDEPNSPMEVWDTFIIPPKVGNINGSITFRVRFVQWYGKTVFHCHILPHEDTGMMQNIMMT